MNPIVIVWGVPADPPVTAVYDALRAQGSPVALLDQWQVASTRVEVTIHPSAQSGPALTGTLRIGSVTYDLRDIRSLYLRAYSHTELPAIARAGPDSALWRHALAVEDALTTWADLTPALVVNRPAAMAANSSKPFQSAWIASLGLNVPDTLLTTDPDAALDFWREHTDVIYKSVSGTRSIVSRLRPEHASRLQNIASCPTQLQQYIPGIEHRVHVVGEKVFACRILCDADDYRYSPEHADLEPCELPAAIAERCRSVAAAMDLPLAGIDLRCTPDGAWYCFEVNPSPGFTYFETQPGNTIAQAVAALLSEAPEAG